MENQETMIIEEKIHSFGELLVGTTLDSEETDSVTKVKKLFAEAANILKDEYANNERSPIKSLLFDHAVGEITNAQMSIVKVITFK